jgi:hypothetical protein
MIRHFIRGKVKEIDGGGSKDAVSQYLFSKRLLLRKNYII